MSPRRSFLSLPGAKVRIAQVDEPAHCSVYPPPVYYCHACSRRTRCPAGSRTKSVLSFSLVATLAYVVVTLVAGIRAHSLALLSEAGHNASDFLALLLSFAAVYFQTRPATDAKTFGYQRAGVLAAFINAATLILISVWIAIEAIHRLSAPVAVQPRLMMIVAAAGVVMNGVIAALLWAWRAMSICGRPSFTWPATRCPLPPSLQGAPASCLPAETGLTLYFPW